MSRLFWQAFYESVYHLCVIEKAGPEMACLPDAWAGVSPGHPRRITDWPVTVRRLKAILMML
jgi:hypothetical protein